MTDVGQTQMSKALPEPLPRSLQVILPLIGMTVYRITRSTSNIPGGRSTPFNANIALGNRILAKVLVLFWKLILASGFRYTTGEFGAGGACKPAESRTNVHSSSAVSQSEGIPAVKLSLPGTTGVCVIVPHENSPVALPSAR